jgi:Zn-dependent protease
MPDFNLPVPQLIAVAVLPILFAITVHEVAHGWVAKQFGDLTAARLGRLTLNPLKHIDPVGTVLVPALLLLLKSGFLFGWARPVPVSFENLRNPKRDMIFVAAAGPAANLLMAIFWGMIVKLSTFLPDTLRWVAEPLMYMGWIGILINSLLLVFNLLPIPPLDGGRVAVGLLPGPMAYQLSRLEPFGVFIVLALAFSGLLWFVINPLVNFVAAVVIRLTGIG